MHCNFGSLPTAGLEHFGDVFSDLVGMMSESQLAELVERMPSSLPSGHGLPDLFDEVESWHPDRAWLEEAADALEYLQAGGADVAIMHCEYEPGPNGFIAIDARCMASTFNMTEGDVLVGGVALLREGEAEPVVHPRIFRLICTNGMVQHRRDGVESILREGSVAETIGNALGQESVNTVTQLRSAALVRITDPRALLERLELSASVDEVMASREEEDDSLYGLVNTVTAHARGVRPFPARLRVEAAAGHLLDMALRPDGFDRSRASARRRGLAGSRTEGVRAGTALAPR